MLRLSLAFLTLWGAAALLRFIAIDTAYEHRIRQRSKQQDVLTSPGREVLQATSLEHPLAVADFAWLAIVQEIGGSLGEASWDRIERWSDIATDIDPLYFVVYHSAAVNLTVYARRSEASDRLLLKGWEKLPHRWELPFLIGYNAYFLRNDFHLASDYLKQASELEGAPRFLGSLAGRMRYQGGDEEGAIELLEMMISTLDGPARDDAEERLQILKSEPRLRKYDAACKQWLEERGMRPTPNELFEQGRVDQEPEDMLGHDITLDEKCIARTQLIRVREFEAIKRVEELAKQGGGIQTSTVTGDEP